MHNSRDRTAICGALVTTRCMTNVLILTVPISNRGKKRHRWGLNLCTIKMECFISMDQLGQNKAWSIEPELKGLSDY